MADLMRGLQLRLSRADEHLHLLAPKVEALAREVTEREILHKFEPDRSHYVVRVAGEPPPAEWSIRVSEVLHHLRSALDNLVCALVISHGGSVHRRTAFPLMFREAGWDRVTTTRGRQTDVLQGVTADERAVIKAAQPYHARNYLPMMIEHPLVHLALGSNRDKHVLMYPCFIRVFQESISEEDLNEAGGMDMLFEGPLIPANETTGKATRFWYGGEEQTIGDNTELIRAELPDPGPNPQMRMYGNFPVEIALGYTIAPLTVANLFAARKEVQRLVDTLKPPLV